MAAVKHATNPNGTWAQRAEEVQEQLQHVPQQMGECIQEHPMTSVLAAFGLGLVAGAGVVALFCASAPEPTTYESMSRRISDAIREAMPRGMFQS